MVREALPVFARDHQTGLMKELNLGSPRSIIPPRDESGAAQFRVLVVDDDEGDRLVTIWLLGKAWPVERHLVVECAVDGAEALERMRNNQYALIVIDWNMPDWNREGVLSAVRKSGPRVPVVVLSSEDQGATERELGTVVAACVNKNELDAYSFGTAIAMSMQLQERQCFVELDLGDDASPNN